MSGAHRSGPSRRAVSCWFWSRARPREGGGLVDEDQRRGIDALLAALPTRSVAARFYVRAIPLARDRRLFERDAEAMEEAALHRSIGFDPALG